MRHFNILFVVLTVGAALGALPLGCDVEARPPADQPTYRDGVSAILDAKCARCHAGPAPAAGYLVNDYRGAIGCTASGRAAVLPAEAAPLLGALDRPDHAGFVTDDERGTLMRWVATGAQSVRPGVHPASFADPRSTTGHAAVLRATRYRALTDPDDRDRCAQCHEGAGTRPEKVSAAALGATACTSCHTETSGVNACSTCHGAPAAGRNYPPRDACFFPADPKKDVHAAHAAPSRSRAVGLDCAACHPRPDVGSFVGAHTDGWIEVWFDHSVAGREAQFDGASKRCTGTCHARGGTSPEPTWAKGDAALDCNACHSSPPKNHFTGPCSSCHKEANTTGTALAAPRLHVNGKVDLGDGSGRCGACHGSGDSPWPSTGAHAAHAAPVSAAPVACETCHTVPSKTDAHPLRAGAAVVRLVGLATTGGANASYDPATKTCASTYCHDGAGASPAARAPRWTDGAAVRACGSCHATPPPPPHAQDTSCGAAGCHQGIVTGAGASLALSPAGKMVHVNGRIDRTAN